MTEGCRYCGCDTIVSDSVFTHSGRRYEVRECLECGLSSLYPFPDHSTLKTALRIFRRHLPGYDPGFDWRSFFARRYLDDGDKVLSIGREDGTLQNTFMKENLHLVQCDAFTPDALSCFSDNEFDAVFVEDNIGFVKDLRGFLDQINRILKDSGLVSFRTRDACSRLNRDRGRENYLLGDFNFMGRRFVRTVFRRHFGSIPTCIMQEKFNDSFIVAYGRLNSGCDRYFMSVLILVHHYLFARLDDATGPRGRVMNTVDMLDRKGVKADISFSLTPYVDENYDLVHLFHNAWETQDAISQMLSVKEADKKVVVSTIYMDMSETNFIINVLGRIFKMPDEDEREAFLEMLARGDLKAGRLHQKMRFYARWNLEEDQRALLEMADRLICFSYTEMRQMSLNLDRQRPFSIVYNSADDELFGESGPEYFIERYGVRDFIISAGHLEWRKNQLMTLYALRDYPEIPVVVVGAEQDEEYHELCRLWAHKNTIFISQLKHRHLASAFAAARAHVQPSWIEGIALSTIEAAMCGCSPVVADRAGEIEYYGDLGFYVNPGSAASIRKAVLAAYGNNHNVREETRRFVRERYSFKRAVDMTIDAYRKVLEAERC